MIAMEPVTKAVIRPVDGGKEIKVHFNPVSLQYSVSNQLKEDGPDKKQYVTQTTAKLTMDLVFDTTDSGKDVRLVTKDIAALLDVENKKGDKKKKFPKVVEFSWGLYTFTGILESFKETIDYFSNNGVPLRSTVNCTFARQKVTLTASEATAGAAAPGLTGQDIVEVPPGKNDSATDVAKKGGDPAAGRKVAAANGLDSMRSLGSGNLAIGDSISLNGPAAFASVSAGAGFGASAGASFGASAGASFGASAGASFGASAGASFGASFGASAGASFGASAGASFGASASAGLSASAGASFSASASAGVTASEGAFAGLRVTTTSVSTGDFTPDRLLPRAEIAYSTSRDASFQLGGRALVEGSASLRADTGATASLTGRIRFEEK